MTQRRHRFTSITVNVDVDEVLCEATDDDLIAELKSRRAVFQTLPDKREWGERIRDCIVRGMDREAMVLLQEIYRALHPEWDAAIVKKYAEAMKLQTPPGAQP